MTIGIAGGTGSGKTTITRRLQQRFSDNVSVIYHDNYYKAHNDMTYEERAKLNYDCPDAFDTELMVRDLTELRNGHSVRCPVRKPAEGSRSCVVAAAASAGRFFQSPVPITPVHFYIHSGKNPL